MLKISAMTQDSAPRGGPRPGSRSERRRATPDRDERSAAAPPASPRHAGPEARLAARLLARLTTDEGFEAALDSAGPPVNRALVRVEAALDDAAALAPRLRPRLEPARGLLERMAEDPFATPRRLLEALAAVERAVEWLLASDPELVRLDAAIAETLACVAEQHAPGARTRLARLRAEERELLASLPGLQSLRRAHEALEGAVRRSVVVRAASLYSDGELLVEAATPDPACCLRLGVTRSWSQDGVRRLRFSLDRTGPRRVAGTLIMDRQGRVAVELVAAAGRAPGSEELERALEEAGVSATVAVQSSAEPPQPLAPAASDMTPLGALDLRA